MDTFGSLSGSRSRGPSDLCKLKVYIGCFIVEYKNTVYKVLIISSIHRLRWVSSGP
jgi:hypothetical protein